jgi:hypothetical protein
MADDGEITGKDCSEEVRALLVVLLRQAGDLHAQIERARAILTSICQQQQTDPYQTLNVQPGCTLQQAREAWELTRRRARRTISGGQSMDQRLSMIDGAYASLLERIGQQHEDA